MIPDSDKLLALSELPTTAPRPDRAGDRWRGIPHRELADTVRQAITDRKWGFENERYSIHGNKFIGYMDIKTGHEGDPDVAHGIGWLHSNDRRHALRMAVGGRVLVCDNGVVAGDVVVGRTHSKNLDLRQLVEDALGRYRAEQRQMDKMIARFKQRTVKPDNVPRFLIELARDKVIPWSGLGPLDAILVADMAKQKRPLSAWEIYNHFTLWVKKFPDTTIPDRINKMREKLEAAAK